MNEPKGWKELVAKMQRGGPPYKPAPTPIIVEERILKKLPTCSDPAAFVPEDEKTMLDHALQWAGKGLHVFSCRHFLGAPEHDNWFAAATTDRGKIINMWTADPAADIAAVPEKSGHYCIVVTGETGRESLEQFEMERGALKPVFRHFNQWDAEHLWFVGSSHSARIGPCLHLVGSGRFVYLPPSFAPDSLRWSK
jgi:hypothetical protein